MPRASHGTLTPRRAGRRPGRCRCPSRSRCRSPAPPRRAANMARAIAQARCWGWWSRVYRTSIAWANSDDTAVATKASPTTTERTTGAGHGRAIAPPKLRENVHKVGTLAGGRDARPPRRQPFPTLGASRRRRSPACRSTTGRSSRPPTRRSARSRRSGWPSWRASTRPRCARTSRTSGSYGTRGRRATTSSTCCTRSRASSASPTTGRSPSSASGNLGQALANYRGFGARGFRIVALVDADPEKVGQRVGDLTIESLDDLPDASRATAASPSASSPRPRTRPRRSPTASSTPASRRSSTSRPTVVTAPPGVSLRKVDLAIELQILSFYQQRRDSAPARTATRRARRAMSVTRPAITGYPVNLVVAGRRCVVVGAGRIAARKIEALLDAGAAVARGRARGRRRGARPGPTPAGSRSPSARSRPPTSTAPGSPPPPPAIPAVDRAVFEAGEARRVWVNSADDPDNCSFTLMSVVRQGDLVVTIGTGGRSPALATWLGGASRRSWGPSTRPCSTCCPRPGKSCGPRGVPPRTPIGSRPSIPACST